MLDACQLFKCLSDETRLASVLMVAKEGELCVCELMAAMEISQPKLSRHLAQLRNCGILDDSRRGQWVYYALAKELPAWARDVINCALDAQTVALAEMQSNLQAMPDRPQCC